MSIPVGSLWRGHVFLFDREREPVTYGSAAGARLLLIVAGLEAIRLVRHQLHLSFLPLGVEIAIYLLLALALTRRVARVTWDQIGFRPWRLWNATEKAYFVEVVVLVNLVFPMLFATRLRAVLSDPTVVWTVFVPYLIFGFYQEVVYRGLLQTELVRRWGAIGGILVSNTLYAFGPLHLAYYSVKPSVAVPMFASIYAIGLLFALVFHRAGNLWIVAVMHAFGNAYAVGLFTGGR